MKNWRGTLTSRLRAAVAASVAIAAGLIFPSTNVLAAVGDITEYPIPVASSFPSAIVTGPDGNLWITEAAGGLGAPPDTLIKMTTSGVMTQYPFPAVHRTPTGIAKGPDGNLWISEQDPGMIAKATTSGTFTEYPIPTIGPASKEIVAGPDGNLWFAEASGNQIGKVTTSGVFTEYPIPTPNSFPVSIAAGPDGNLWFTEVMGNNVGKVTTSGVFTEYPIPTVSSGPGGIVAGPDGNLWLTEGNNVAKVTTSGVFTEYAIPTAMAGPAGIAAGPDGNLWFTETGGNKVAKVTTSGVLTEFTVPTPNASLGGIAAGPDGNVWFNETGANQVGKVTVTVAASSYVVGVVGTDNGLYVLHSGSPSFTGLGGVLLGAPAVVAIPQTSGSAVPLYIATGSDHALWVRNDSQGWQILSGNPTNCIDNPAGAVIAGTLYVACEGPDHALWHAETAAPSGTNLPALNVSSWRLLGGQLSAGPAVANVAGTPTYVVVGSDTHVYFRDLTNPSFRGSNWACIGHPALAAFGATAYFACHGTDGVLWYSTNTGSGWSAIQPLGGQLIDGVGLAATATGPVFFAEGTDGAVYHRSISFGWAADGGQVRLGVGASAV